MAYDYDHRRYLLVRRMRFIRWFENAILAMAYVAMLCITLTAVCAIGKLTFNFLMEIF